MTSEFRILALVGLAVIVEVGYFHVDAGTAVTVTAFLGTLALATLKWLSQRNVLLSLYRSLKTIFPVATLVLLAIVAWRTYQLGPVVGQHSNPATAARVAGWIFQLRLTLGAVAVVVAGLIMFLLWRARSARFANSRLAVLKDTILKVERVLLSDVSKEDRLRAAVRICLSGLLAMLTLNPWHWLLQKFRFLKPSLCSLHVLFLTPEASDKRFAIFDFAVDDRIPARRVEILQRLQSSHHPAFLDEDGFRRLIELAKGENHDGWLRRYFNLKDRAKVISAAGWISVHNEPELCQDTRMCLAYDGSPFRDLLGSGYTALEIAWIETRSFVGCPVRMRGLGADPAPVLFASKNVRNGFSGEDAQAVEAVAAVLSRIRSFGEEVTDDHSPGG